MFRIVFSIFITFYIFLTIIIQCFPMMFGDGFYYCIYTSEVKRDMIEEFAYKNSSIADRNVKLHCYIKCVMEEYGILNNETRLSVDVVGDKDLETRNSFNKCMNEAYKQLYACTIAFNTFKCIQKVLE
ncbi:uncharacterized protein LOC129917860 [Episyrphus balteatus]|uniref:uncharacterized protein LOC129917860 n=1 Tax=Episyrphus balteatus TaxID=286459 RepID=UPI002486CC05|nr:uncharacterized protein LOC129917860 [Episyrphus balteatus]